jgi:hypothetical protein
MFYERVDLFLNSAESLLTGTVDVAEAEANAMVAKLSLKCLRRIVAYGYPERSQKEYGFKSTFNQAEDPMVRISRTAIT